MGFHGMDAGKQNQSGVWARLSALGSKALVSGITILTLILLFSFLTIWNGRYDAGYRAGAGEGAVYKGLYNDQKKTNGELRVQNDRKANEITRLTGKVEQLKAKEGLFSPKVKQAEIDDMRKSAEFKLREADRSELEALQEAKSVGEIIGRAEKDEARVVELNNELRFCSRNLQRSMVFNGIFIVGLIGISIFWRQRDELLRLDSSYREIPNQPTIRVSPVSDSPDLGLLNNSSKGQEQKALPSEKSTDEES